MWAATEARAVGQGGITGVARATGTAYSTIMRGLAEPQTGGSAAPGRVRRRGGGRKRTVEKDPTLLADLEGLVEPTAADDPMPPLRWTTKSVRQLAATLQAMGHGVGRQLVAELLDTGGDSLQGNRKTREGTRHPDRDAQFRYINQQVRRWPARGQPVISVDTKKKELVGDFKSAGQQWRPKGQPVRVHDFILPEQGKTIPYGVYDLTRNAGWVSVGVTSDTASFAVRTIRRWWQKMGRPRYPRARALLITADAGGQQQPAGAPVEVGAAATGESHRAGDHRRPLPPGNEQVERDRASPLLLYQPRLAGPAPREPGRDRQPDRRDGHGHFESTCFPSCGEVRSAQPPQLRTARRFRAAASTTSPSEGSHPCAGFLDERSWAHDTHSRARTEVSDVMGHEHPRPRADRRGEDRDVLGLGKLARPFAGAWSRPVDLDRNRAEELLEERRGFRELGGQIPSNLPHRGLGEDQTKKAQFPENQDGGAGVRAGQQPGDQDVSIDADKYRLSLLGPGHPDPSRKAFALDANIPSRPRAVGRRAAED
jgi:hypothetical protein